MNNQLPMFGSKKIMIFLTVLFIGGCELFENDDQSFQLPSGWSKVDALKGGLVSTFYTNDQYIYVGKEALGIAYSNHTLDKWTNIYNGLDDIDHNDTPTLDRKTIRALMEKDGVLYAGIETSVGVGGYEGTYYEFVGGLYRYNDVNDHWDYSGFKEFNINDMEIVSDKIVIGTQNGFRILENWNNVWTDHTFGLEGYNISNISSMNEQIFLSSNWGLFRHHVNGLNHTNIKTGPIATLTINTVLANDDKVYVGTNNGIYISKDIGATWTEDNTGILNDEEFGYSNISFLTMIDSTIIGIYSFDIMRSQGMDYLPYRISTGIIYKDISESDWSTIEFQGEYLNDGESIELYSIGAVDEKILVSIYKGNAIGSTNNEVWVNSKILSN